MAVLYHQGQFPPGALDWPQLLPLIGPANAAVARYEGVLHGIPNPNVLLSPLTTQEAVLSSRIEGTQATIGEVLEFEAEGQPGDESTPKKADIHEVLNYRAALAEASRLLETLPLSQRLIRLTHERLMQGVRGRNKAPGEYRRIPNWIGPEGCSIEQARFVPCSAEALPAAMDAWERYIHDLAPDALIQLAVLHAEFEAIHPFLDGNGRLGRLIIPLFLRPRACCPRRISTCPSIWKATGTNITIVCWLCRAMVTGPAGADFFCARSSNRRARTRPRRRRSTHSTPRARTGWSRPPARNTGCGRWTGSSVARFLSPRISWRRRIFPVRPPSASCGWCATAAFCARSGPRVADGPPCWPFPSF